MKHKISTWKITNLFYHIINLSSILKIMTKQDFFSRQQSKGTFSWGTIRQQPQKSKNSHTGTWLTIIIIIVLIAVGIVYKNDIFDQKIEPIENESTYVIWTDIEVEGKLSSDWDILNYTHSITNSEWEIYLLKSKTISLNNITNLSWTYTIEGTIESIYNGKPLVEVSSITTTSQEWNNEWEAVSIEDNTPQGIYIAKAWLGFSQEFFDNFALVWDNHDNGSITVKNLDNNETTTINYFTCTDAWDTNCKQLTKTFESNAIKKITTINWDTFYKLPDVKSWYFQNNNRRGYFINNANDEEVEKLKDYIIIPNLESISKIVNRYGLKACFWNDKWMNTIKSHTAEKVDWNILVTMKWEWEKLFTCEAVIDLSLPTKLEFIDIKVEDKPEVTTGANEEVKEETKQEIKEEVKEEEKTEAKETAKETVSVETPSTKQFAINLAKPMTYNWRWYTMIFPSSNISYTSDATDEDFNQAGVRCTHAIKAIQYKNKEQLKDNPSVTIYECTAKNWIQVQWNNYIIKELGDKKFVIQINDPAWYDFAKNITIESL